MLLVLSFEIPIISLLRDNVFTFFLFFIDLLFLDPHFMLFGVFTFLLFVFFAVWKVGIKEMIRIEWKKWIIFFYSKVKVEA